MSVWEEFFARHAPHYMENMFVRNTSGECDFAEREMGLQEHGAILDMGCGTGRHSVELARRGYRVTAVDLSEAMLAEARKAALEAGVEVQWVQVDGREFRTEHPFDAAICLCEGGIGLIEPGEDAFVHDGDMLRAIAAALKSGAPFLLTALNGYRPIRAASDADVQEGKFDPATQRSYVEEEMDLPEGRTKLRYEERLLTPPEMARLLAESGFAVCAVWGGTAGSWHKAPVRLDEMEAMYLCRKG